MYVIHLPLFRLHKLVTVTRSECSEEEEEEGREEEGRGEGGGEGGRRNGRVQEKVMMMKGHEEVEQTSTREGERMGRGEEGEGKGGVGEVRERVACLSALIPVLVTVPSLHHAAHSGQL